jgi:hypothetical protein
LLALDPTEAEEKKRCTLTEWRTTLKFTQAQKRASLVKGGNNGQEAFRSRRLVENSESLFRNQGCQIFLGATYQNGEKLTE